MTIASIAKKVVSKGLSIGKKVAKGAAMIGGVALLGLHHLGKKEIAEREHPKNNPPPLPEFKQTKPFDKKVVPPPKPSGFEAISQEAMEEREGIVRPKKKKKDKAKDLGKKLIPSNPLNKKNP